MQEARADERTPGVERGRPLTIEVDGRSIEAYEGETVLGVLWAAGVRTLRVTPLRKAPRGFFCGMGTCFDCLIDVDGHHNVRACLEPVRPGMRISTAGSSHARG